MHPLSVLQIHHISWNQVCLNIFFELFKALGSRSNVRATCPAAPRRLCAAASTWTQRGQQPQLVWSTVWITADFRKFHLQGHGVTWAAASKQQLQYFRVDTAVEMWQLWEDAWRSPQVLVNLIYMKTPERRKRGKRGMQLIVGNHSSREVISTGFVGYSFVAGLHTTFRLQFPLSFHLKQFDLRSPHLKQREAPNCLRSSAIWEVVLFFGCIK